MTTLHVRVHDAVRAFQRARAKGDADLCAVQLGEIEDLVEIAARHGVDIDSGYHALGHAA